MRIETHVITPKKAKAWLTTNTQNRNVRKSHVDFLASEMVNGRFLRTHQGIAFDENGVLIDGQHRLMAIEKSGVTVEMVVCFDVEKDSFLVTDKGLMRTHVDATGMDKNKVAVINFLLGYPIGTANKFSSSDIVQVSERIGNLYERLIGCCGAAKRVFASAPVRSAVIVRAFSATPAEADQTFKQYRNIVLLDFDRMTPIAKSFVKQVLDNRTGAYGIIGGGGRQTLLFLKSMDVFNPKMQNITRLRGADRSNDDYEDAVKRVIGKIV